MKLNYQQSLNNFSEAFHLSKKETSKGKEYIPGGFSRRTFGYGPHAIFIDKGEAQYLHTIEGKSYSTSIIISPLMYWATIIQRS